MLPLRRPKPSTGPSEGLDTALDLTVKGLEVAKDTIVDALSVPGIGTVMSVAIGILKKLQAARLNRGALESLRTEMESLLNTLQGLANAVKTALPVDMYPVGSSARNHAKDEAFKSAGLAGRVDELASVLIEISAKAGDLNSRKRFTQVLHSSGDAKAINDMKDSIVVAHRNFQTIGGVMIEAKVTAALSDIKSVIAKQDAAEEQSVLDKIPRVDAALYQSATNAMKARIQEGTREAIIASLETWVEAQFCEGGEGALPVRVFVGEAGTGKSTVASEFSKLLEKKRLLAATYFFTRGLPDLNSTTKVLPTIASQFARSQPALRRPIVDAAREHLGIQQLERQFDDLIDRPLRSLPSSHPPFFVVLDGLDECTEDGPELVPRLLRLLLSAAVRQGSPLRLFLVTRPEPQYIHDTFAAPLMKPHIATMTMQQYWDTVDSDIDRFIRARLAENDTSQAWSDDNPYVVGTIVHKSEKLFIYARTAIDFILHDPHDSFTMRERYDLLMNPKQTFGLAPLDALYRTVLDSVFPPKEHYPKMQERLIRVLEYLVALQESISLATLEELTLMPTSESVPILNKLRSVVFFERNNIYSEFRIIHATFREFLVDRSRAGGAFYVYAEEAHGRLADECTAAMRSFVAKNWTNTAADAMVVLQYITSDPSIDHFLYACVYRDRHLSRQTAAPQGSPAYQRNVEGDPHPIPSFLSYTHRSEVEMIWRLVCTIVNQLRRSLSPGSPWEDAVSSLDNLVQHTFGHDVYRWPRVTTLSIILDIQALENRCVPDDTPDDPVWPTTCTAATLYDQYAQQLANALKEPPGYKDAHEEAHRNFHRAIVAAGLTPGHPFEAEYSLAAGRERKRRWQLVNFMRSGLLFDQSAC